MSFHMKSEMIGTGKATFADFTIERFRSSVFTNVSSELVRSRKSPYTVGECTQIWLLACNRTEFRLYFHGKMGWLKNPRTRKLHILFVIIFTFFVGEINTFGISIGGNSIQRTLRLDDLSSTGQLKVCLVS